MMAQTSSKQPLDDLGRLYIEPTGLFHHLVAAAGLNPRVDFRNRDLRAMRFHDADLSGFDFSNSDLRGTGIRFAKTAINISHFKGCQLDPEDHVWLGGNTRSAPRPGNVSDVLLPGAVLGGKYKVERLLGRGGFGATYLATTGIGEDITSRSAPTSFDACASELHGGIAIKEFLPRQFAARVPGGTTVSVYADSQDAFDVCLQQFLGEARILAQFRDHPGIVCVLDSFPENGTGYMVMEYLDGSTLEHYLGTVGPLEITVALRLLVPVADALRACHTAGLIHRDISPDNIFLMTDGRVKVLDFGAARFAHTSRNSNVSVILKEGYAPFEQYQRDGRIGPWTDIYALTATLYRLLTGELPAAAPDRIADATLPPLSRKGVKTSPALQVLLEKGMAMRPERRYQTIDAFLSDVQVVLGTSASTRQSLGTASVGQWLRSRGRRLMARSTGSRTTR